MTDAVKPIRKSTLDILMRDGVNAYMEEVRRQDMRERRAEHLQWVQNNKEEIEAMLADDESSHQFEAEQIKPEEKS